MSGLDGIISLLARIDISESEKDALAQDLEHIVKYVSELGKISLRASDEEAKENSNIMRHDGVPHASCLYTDVLLEEVPERDGAYASVLKVIKND